MSCRRCPSSHTQLAERRSPKLCSDTAISTALTNAWGSDFPSGAAGQGDAGSIQIARALQQHTNDKLVELDLGYNEIKDDGACAIAQARTLLPGHIAGVALGYLAAAAADDISAYGATCHSDRNVADMYIMASDADCLRDCRHLHVFIHACIQTIVQALKANPEGAPRELKISSNRLTRFGQIALQEALDMVRLSQCQI